MTANPQFFLGAFEGDQLVGVVVLSNGLRKGWINRLATDPEYQRRGVALALIAESEKTLRESGVKIFCVLVGSSNAASRRLFKKCGYVEHHGIVYFSKRDSDDV
jgi:ribosomal protein S18 acetylase RimI-like enzyme